MLGWRIGERRDRAVSLFSRCGLDPVCHRGHPRRGSVELRPHVPLHMGTAALATPTDTGALGWAALPPGWWRLIGETALARDPAAREKVSDLTVFSRR